MPDIYAIEHTIRAVYVIERDTWLWYPRFLLNLAQWDFDHA